MNNLLFKTLGGILFLKSIRHTMIGCIALNSTDIEDVLIEL